MKRSADPGAIPKRPGKYPAGIFTVGHSTRSIAEFTSLLKAHQISRVVDVRTIPRSRHNPQFNTESLADALKQVGVAYTHAPGLGGLRHATRTSPNAGWRNSSFRGFADYMQTAPFETALEKLIQFGARDRTAILCAEAVPWRCHRSLIADALLVRGIPAHHIFSETQCKPHTLTPFARVQGTHLTYPPEDPAASDMLPLKCHRAAIPR